MKHLIIYIDDDQANVETFRRAFRFDYELATATSAAEGLELVRRHPDAALIVADQRMPQMKGTEFLERAMQMNPHAQRIILTAFTDLDALLAAIQRGHVYDYVVKPWEPAALKERMERAIALYDERIERVKQLTAARAKAEALTEMVREQHDFANIVGADGDLLPVIEQVRKVAPTNAAVIIRGESGTGKELIAHALHAASARAERPFVKLNCAALSPGVLESELFGHAKGAFTGAVAARAGRFEQADGGTLFLDEIGDLPEPVQVKLLRVLQEGEFERVGSNQTIRADVRLITATHQPLERLIEAGRFRHDLFYRLNVIPIVVPPLRERPQDLPRLIDHFFQKFCAETGRTVSMGEEAKRLLCAYEWPGNVRELRNALERAVILGEGELSAADFSMDLAAQGDAASQIASVASTERAVSLLSAIHEENARSLADALRRANGNVSEAARILGVARSTLLYRLRKYRVL
jgi:DNA-binding NtrC family response regulator